MNLTITRCARVADVPAELAEAFKHMPHYPRNDPARDSYPETYRRGTPDEHTVHYDPLSTEGYNRDDLYLDGFALAGHQPDGRAVYLLRFNGTRFAAYVLGSTMYEPGRKARAQEKCVELIAEGGLWSFTDGKIVAHVAPPEPEPVPVPAVPVFKPTTLGGVVFAFAANDPGVKAWEAYPGTVLPDGHDCDDLANRFALFAAACGLPSEVIRYEPATEVPFLGEHYVAVIDGIAVDWTARQFYNLPNDRADWLDPAAIPVPVLYSVNDRHPYLPRVGYIVTQTAEHSPDVTPAPAPTWPDRADVDTMIDFHTWQTAVADEDTVLGFRDWQRQQAANAA